MKKLFILSLAVAVTATMATPVAAKPKAKQADTAFVFTEVVTVPHTSVKDQNKSGTCWCFAGTGFFENEILRKTGRTLDLSEMYTVRKCYEDKADRYVRMYGHTNFGPGGSVVDVPYVLERYGAMPEEAYKGLDYGEDKHVHGELNNILTGLVKTVVSKPDKKISKAWKKAMNGVLDAYLGEVPEQFEFEGVMYTPESFYKTLDINTDDYVTLTSFSHHPYYKPFVFEVADNWLWSSCLNVPLDEFKQVVDYALENGYTISWAADVSEQGFKWNTGVALMPKGKEEGDMTGTELARWVKLSDKDRVADKYNFVAPPVEEIEVTPEMRQEMFDSQETTDDHGMIIVGIATDQTGKRYYKVKNSWDTNQVYDGYIYVSEPYLLAKTMNIYLHKDGIPAEIASKLNIR